MNARSRMQLALALMALCAGIVPLLGCANISELSLAQAADARMTPPDKKVTIVSIPGLSFLETGEPQLDEWPRLRRIALHGAAGALNVRTPGKGLEDSYLTLGAGAPASGSSQSQGLNRGETKDGYPADELYVRYNGTLPEEAGVIVPGIAAIDAENREGTYGAVAGLLGETLRQHGIKTYVFGNGESARGTASEADQMKRYAPFMLMNRAGWVTGGDVGGGTLVPSAARPYSVKTDYSYILRRWEQADRPSVVLIELGDLSRLYGEKPWYREDRFTQVKRQTMREMDDFIGRLCARTTGGDSLWILSPQANSDALGEKMMLTPIFKYNSGMRQSILVSDTTRRNGIVANHDVAPSLLREFGIDTPRGMIGMPMRSEPMERQTLWLQDQLEKIRRVYLLRPKLLYAFVFYEIAVLLIGLLAALIGWRWRKSDLWLTAPLMSLLVSPPLMLATGWLSGSPIAVMAAAFVIGVIGMSLLVSRLPLFAALALVSAATVVLLLLDGVTGARAMKFSVLGYDPMIGARYYGIGNEFMGVLIGAAVLASSVLLQKRAWRHAEKPFTPAIKVAAAGAYALISVYLAAPFLGTNAGGAITAVIAFGIAWARSFCAGKMRELSWSRLALLIGLLLTAALFVLWLLNSVIPMQEQQHSHIGRAMRLAAEGRIDWIGQMIVRKLQMNWHLIAVSSWSKVLFTSLFVAAVLVLRPGGLFRVWQMRYPYMMYGFSANTIGAITALLCNDSGIVAAATMIVYVAVPMLLLKLEGNKVTSSGKREEAVFEKIAPHS